MNRVIVLAALLFIIACRQKTATLRPLDLNAYGIPLVILAPDSATVLEKDYQFMRDITIRKGTDFDLQVFELIASSPDAAGEKLHQLASVRQDPFFIQIIKEDDLGFIFSKRLDSLHVDYDFRYIRLFGEKEIIFQTGLASSFSLNEVKRMYRAVKQ